MRPPSPRHTSFGPRRLVHDCRESFDPQMVVWPATIAARGGAERAGLAPSSSGAARAKKSRWGGNGTWAFLGMTACLPRPTPPHPTARSTTGAALTHYSLPLKSYTRSPLASPGLGALKSVSSSHSAPRLLLIVCSPICMSDGAG